MPGLVLKLAPGERVMVNGVVMENGDRRSRITVITPDAQILRLKDALHPHEVNTPVKRVCYIAQLLLAGEADPAEARQQLLRGIEQLSQVFRDPDSVRLLGAATDHVLKDRTYPALKSLRQLLPREARLFEHSGQVHE
jgi:flagellar protein FlbT